MNDSIFGCGSKNWMLVLDGFEMCFLGVISSKFFIFILIFGFFF